MKIIPQEFTPRDVYQLDFFDLGYGERRPQICKDADPDALYCQIIGKYNLQFKGYSTIKPYEHMNERCPSMGPDYIRPDGC